MNEKSLLAKYSFFLKFFEVTKETLVVSCLSFSAILYFLSNRQIQLIYALPLPFILLMCLSYSEVYVSKFSIQTLFVFILITITSLIININQILNWKIVLRDFIILSGPYFVFLFNLKFKHVHVITLFWTTFICYLLSLEISLLELFNLNNLAFVKSILFPQSTNRATGFIFGFILGVYPIYFLAKKKYSYFILSLLFIFIASKRVALFGLGFVFIIYIINNGKLLTFKKGIIYVAMAFLAINLVDIVTYLNKNIFKTKRNTTEILNSRDLFYNAIRHEIDIKNPIHFLFGNGGGQMDAKLSNNLPYEYRNSTGLSHVHNEYLKIIYDYGLIGLIVFFIMMVSITKYNKFSIYFFGYSLAVFMLDNCLLFVFYFYLLGIISRVDYGFEKNKDFS